MIDSIQGGPWKKVSKLTLRKSIELAKLFSGTHPPSFTQLSACYCNQAGSYKETLFLKIEVELPQTLKADIRRKEPIAVVFTEDDIETPTAFALRDDFPDNVSHLNLCEFKYPKSLCLTNQTMRDAAIKWTAASFLESIRWWLSETACGSLHGKDQPLEPLIEPSSDILILPPIIELITVQALYIYDIYEESDRNIRIAVLRPKSERPLPFMSIVISVKPQVHGVISHRPTNLLDLHQLMKQYSEDIFDTVESQIKQWSKDEEHFQNHMNAGLLVVLLLPKKRSASEKEEAVDVFVFSTRTKIGDIGCKLGFLGCHNGVYVPVIGSTQLGDLKDVRLTMHNAVLLMTTDVAAQCNAVNSFDPICIVAIGAGALGSHVISNLARMGVGNWVIVDNDVLLPHNLARHQLFGIIGRPKSETLARHLRGLFIQQIVEDDLVSDIMVLPEEKSSLLTDLTESDVILDMSASIAVARHLARDIDTPARRISLFLNPSGSDLILFAEDKARSIPADYLEMLYYRAISRNDELAKHLVSPKEEIRFGNSCRDISSRIPQAAFAVHGGIGSVAIRKAIDEGKACISVWCAGADFQISKIDVKLTSFTEKQTKVWTLVIANDMLENIVEQRKAMLANETGGVLIGSYDMQRKVIYVVDSLEAPEDSEHQPTMYIRGCDGLRKRTEEISNYTDGWLEYIGEWHSHPKGYTCRPSNADKELLAWLTERFSRDSHPALMMIAADNDNFGWYVE